MRGHRCDFLMYIYLISLNAFDLHLNVWPPECVVHDTDPPQLLRSNCYLPMDSLVGMSIEEVNIYTWHDLIHAVTISTTDCLQKICFLWPLYVLDRGSIRHFFSQNFCQNSEYFWEFLPNFCVKFYPKKRVITTFATKKARKCDKKRVIATLTDSRQKKRVNHLYIGDP